MFIKNGAKIIAGKICGTQVTIKTTDGDNFNRTLNDNYFAASTADTSGISMKICSDNLTIDENDYEIPQNVIPFTFTSATRAITGNGTVTYTFVGTNTEKPFTIKSILLTMGIYDWSEQFLIYENNVPDRVVNTNETFTYTVKFVAR